jgi:CIC family chloride channel protein
MYSSIITSAITVGFGGSVGLEGPTVSTGSAIGSNLSRLFRLNYKNTILFIGCATSGAMAAIFNAPIAAMIFSLEVLMLDLTLSSLIPLLVASISASLTSYFFMGKDVLFHFNLQESFVLKDIPYFILIGILCGLISLYFTKLHTFTLGLFKKMSNIWLRAVIGGSLLGLLIYLLPPLYGEGYVTVNTLLSGNYVDVIKNSFLEPFAQNPFIIILFFGILTLVKVFATSFTLGAKGVGGIFAPSLFLGSILGFFFAFTLNSFGFDKLSLINFTLVGMAGTLAGILHAPLTAIFLIAELTNGYELILPLMITSALSYITIKTFEPHSLYTSQLAHRGELITHHKDKAVLTLLKLEKVIEKNFVPVSPDDSLRELVKAIKNSSRNIFPVIDKEKNFLGLVPLDNIRNIMFEHELYDTVLVSELMIDPPLVISLEDSMEDVMNKLKDTGLWNLPVVSHGKYLGFVSRANIFNAYRKLLIEFSED